MNRKPSKRLNDESEESTNARIKRLSKELSNAERELQLSEQINSQLERIRITSNRIKEVSNRLLYQIADLDDRQLEDLHQTESKCKSELKKLENRLEMLRQIQQNNCRLSVRPIKATKTANNTFLIDDKEVFVEGEHYEGPVVDDETDIDSSREPSRESSHEPSRESSRNSSRQSGSTIEAKSSRQSSAATSLASDSLMDGLGAKDSRRGRKRIIPERFESFPNQKSRSKRLNVN